MPDDYGYSADAAGFWSNKFGGVAAVYLNVRKGNPVKTGHYYYFAEYSWGVDIRTIHFTAEHGWNTYGLKDEKECSGFGKDNDPNYIGYAPIRDGIYIPKESEIIDDMLDEVIATRRTDPLLNGEIRYDSDEESRKWEYIENLEDALTETKDILRTCEVEGWSNCIF